MRGFRLLGKLSDAAATHDTYDESDLLFFAPDRLGEEMREGPGIRARDFNMAACWSAAVAGLCPDDYVFVAVAIGENCFKRRLQ